MSRNVLHFLFLVLLAVGAAAGVEVTTPVEVAGGRGEISTGGGDVGERSGVDVKGDGGGGNVDRSKFSTVCWSRWEGHSLVCLVLVFTPSTISVLWSITVQSLHLELEGNSSVTVSRLGHAKVECRPPHRMQKFRDPLSVGLSGFQVRQFCCKKGLR